MEPLARVALVVIRTHGGGGHLTTAQGVMMTVGILLGVALLLLTVFWFAMIRPARRHRRVLRDGVPAIAVIRRVHDPNTRIRGSRFIVRIDLDVAAPDGRTVPASTRTVLDLMRDAPVREGTTVPVRVLRDDPARVAIDWEAAAARR